MSSMIIPSGDALKLDFTLSDGAENFFPQAHVYDADDVEVAGSPFDLSHQALGRYTNNDVFLADGRYYALYITYEDSGHTTIAPQYARATDGYTVDDRIAESDRTDTNVISIRGKTDQMDFTNNNIHSEVKVNSDKTDYELSAAGLVAVENQVWDADNSQHLGAGTTGFNLDQASAGGDPQGVADAVWGEGRNEQTTPGSFGEAIQGVITDARANNLDNLDDTVSSRLSTSDANSINDEQLLEHQETQDAIQAVSEKVDPDDFANGVWNAARASYGGSGTFGEGNQGELSVARADLLDNLSRVDVVLSTRSTQTSVDNTPDLVWDVNLPDHQIEDSTGEAQEVARAGNDPVDIAQEVWAQQTGDNNEPGSFGEANNRTAFNTDDIKEKTDQLNFDGVRVRAKSEVVTDKDGYALSGQSRNEITDNVWEELLSDHQTPGTTGEALGLAASSSDPNAAAAAVWDSITSDYTTNNTFGLLMQLIKGDTESIQNSLDDGNTGLGAIKQQVIDSEGNIIDEVNENESKIDAIIPHNDNQTQILTDEINENEQKIDNLSGQLTNAESNIIDEVNENEAKIDQGLANQDFLASNPVANAVMLDTMERPESGTKEYEITMTTFVAGRQADADTAPTVTITRTDTGGTVFGPTQLTNTGVGTYRTVWAISSGTDLYNAVATFDSVISGNNLRIFRMTEIISYQGTLTDIDTKADTIISTTNDTNNTVKHPIYGNEKLKEGQDDIIAEVDENQVIGENIQERTNRLPDNPASTEDTEVTNTLIGNLPSQSDIDNSLNQQTAEIKGNDNVDNTQVRDQVISSAAGLVSNTDPRLDNLDETISSRSTLTVAEVWNYFNRTLTSSSDFGIEDAQLVWEVLTSEVIPDGSYGDLLRTNLDATVSSRSTSQEVSDLLTGVAQESTLNSSTQTLLGEHNDTQNDIAFVKADTEQIKFKTDNLPSDPAADSTVTSDGAQTRSDISETDLKVDGIKERTDNLPDDPARESSVQAIPTNTVQSDDARLANLDVAVSTRSTLDISDFSDFPRNSDLAQTESNIIDEVNENEAKIDDVKTDTTAIKAKTDNLPTDPASTTDVNNSTNTILAAIPDIDDTANAVWDAQTSEHQVSGSFGEQSTQTKDGVDQANAGQDNLATKQDVEDASTPSYQNRASTVFDNTASLQKVMAWATLNGERRADTSNCVVTVKDDDSNELWTQTLATPTSDGIFEFDNSIPSIAAGDNYYIVVEIDVDGAKRISYEPFFTV